MHHPIALAVLFPFALTLTGSLTAQTPTVTVRAASLLGESAHNGPFSALQTLPIGPLPTVGSVDAISTSGLSLVEASTAWGATTTETLAGFVAEQHLTVRGSTNGDAVSGPNQIVFAITAAVPRVATLTVHLTKVASPGVSSSSVLVDVGNDGSLDITGSSQVVTLVDSVVLGPVPFEVRVVFAGFIPIGQTGNVNLDDQVLVQFVPDNHLSVLPAAAGCARLAATLQPSWAGDGVLLDVDPTAAPPLVLGVFGLAPAPALLPNPLASLPCLMLPRPDLVVGFAPGGFVLSLPLAVRPVNVWAQCVLLDTAGLATTNGFVVVAP